MSDTMRNSSARRLIVVSSIAAALVGRVFVGRATSDQPHMQSALEHLKTAKGELDQATADKGGHRVKALRLVNQAIDQVQAGIEFDRRH